ncbi:hypothetical protein BCR44DRAFT_1114802 [Catenaria anguillulae PL171]|uniref:Uncharacterized protein n=1 Tax=Catenaria anguillulae PL171 TaxID=765915 RepID=A0A1Y2HLZ0_9FUNG|nr:hypothetical protein BCR44DRAFT_1114802 [Catenaria anguillulae PL171]
MRTEAERSNASTVHPSQTALFSSLSSPDKDNDRLEPASDSTTTMPRQHQHPLSPIRRGRKRINCFATVMYWLGFLLFLVFTFAYVGLLQLFVLQGQVFQTKTANVGFYIHVIPGLIYFAIGFAQFSSTLRTRFPNLHRRLGWTYFGLTLITTVGVVVILVGGSHAKESSVIATITGVPLWLALQVSAIRAIRNGNVALHRRQQLRAFVLSFSIVFMRPGVMLLNAFVPMPAENMGELLKTVIWWVFVWAVMFTEAYLVKRRAVFEVPSSVVMLPAAARSSVGGNGSDSEADADKQVLVSSAHVLDPESGSIVSDLAHEAQWHPVCLVHSEYLNPTIVCLDIFCSIISVARRSRPTHCPVMHLIEYHCCPVLLAHHLAHHARQPANRTVRAPGTRRRHVNTY